MNWDKVISELERGDNLNADIEETKNYLFEVNFFSGRGSLTKIFPDAGQ